MRKHANGRFMLPLSIVMVLVCPEAGAWLGLGGYLVWEKKFSSSKDNRGLKMFPVPVSICNSNKAENMA